MQIVRLLLAKYSPTTLADTKEFCTIGPTSTNEHVSSANRPEVVCSSKHIYQTSGTQDASNASRWSSDLWCARLGIHREIHSSTTRPLKAFEVSNMCPSFFTTSIYSLIPWSAETTEIGTKKVKYVKKYKTIIRIPSNMTYFERRLARLYLLNFAKCFKGVVCQIKMALQIWGMAKISSFTKGHPKLAMFESKILSNCSSKMLTYSKSVKTTTVAKLPKVPSCKHEPLMSKTNPRFSACILQHWIIPGWNPTSNIYGP